MRNPVKNDNSVNQSHTSGPSIYLPKPNNNVWRETVGDPEGKFNGPAGNRVCKYSRKVYYLEQI